MGPETKTTACMPVQISLKMIVPQWHSSPTKGFKMLVQVQNIKTKSDLQSSITKLNVSKSKIYEGINSKSLDAVIADIKNSSGRQMTIIVIEGN
jgi:hypothetical protein